MHILLLYTSYCCTHLTAAEIFPVLVYRHRSSMESGSVSTSSWYNLPWLLRIQQLWSVTTKAWTLLSRVRLCPLLPRVLEGPRFAEPLKSHRKSKGTLDTTFPHQILSSWGLSWLYWWLAVMQAFTFTGFLAQTHVAGELCSDPAPSHSSRSALGGTLLARGLLTALPGAHRPKGAPTCFGDGAEGFKVGIWREG